MTKDERKEYMKEWNIKNKDKNNKRRIKYRQELSIEDKESISTQNKKYRSTPEFKEKQKENNKIYYQKNKEEILSKKKEYGKDNKESISESYKKFYNKNKQDLYLYRKNKRKTNSLYRLSINIRNMIRYTLIDGGYKKKTKTIDILGCSFSEFRTYLESKFESWMTWENRGLYNGELNYGWDIDHILPISSAKTEDEIIKLNHYTNLQPMCGYTNRHIKMDSILECS